MPGEKILIIEDNENTQELLKIVFEKEGYEVILVATSSEALDKAKEERPNLIILDLILPDMDGYQLLELIKQEPQLTSIPVIILTSVRELNNKLRGLRLGVMDYITKPFQREELTTRVRNVLDFYNMKLQNSQDSNSPKPFGRLFSYLEEKSITELIPVVRKEAKLGYEYPEAAKVLKPDDIGGEIFILERLAKEKQLDRVFYDVIHICPTCGHHDLNFREICPHCESAEIMTFEVIIHIKCGHKALEYEFNRNGQMVCPACNRPLSGEGIDYEKANRPVIQCLSCTKKFPESVVNCRCMNCDRIFEVAKAIKRKIYSYHYRKFKDDLAEDPLVLQDRIMQKPPLTTPSEEKPDEAFSQIQKAFAEVGLETVNWQFFPNQLHLEIKRTQKNNSNLCLLKLTLLQEGGLKFESINDLQQPELQKILLILKKCLRDLDVISIKNPTEYIIMLPETPLSMAKILGQRIQNYINQLMVPAKAEVALSAYPEDGNKAEELLEVINLNLAILKPDDSQEDFTLI